MTAGMYCDAELLSVHICSWRFRQIGAQEWKRAALRSGKPSGLLLLLAEVQAEVQGPGVARRLSPRASVNLGHAAHPSHAVAQR